MFNSNVLWILAAFVVYMGVMIAIGAKYMKSTKNSEDYFLGGRGLSGWVAALSAQASDMSGWLLMGLPGAVYAFGTGQAWIAIGLFIGTVCNWIFISGRQINYRECKTFHTSVGISDSIISGLLSISSLYFAARSSTVGSLSCVGATLIIQRTPCA